LCFSYGATFAIAAALFDAGNVVWGALLFFLFPVMRMSLRFRPGKGYYMIGYIGRVGGEMRTPSGMVTRQRDPIRFKILLFLEIATVAFLMVSVLYSLTRG